MAGGRRFMNIPTVILPGLRIWGAGHGDLLSAAFLFKTAWFMAAVMLFPSGSH